MNNLNKVSVLIPYYRHKNYIEECLQSIVAQEYENIEIIVVDDFSNDGSVSFLKGLQERFDFTLIINEFNTGCTKAIMKAYSQSTGDFISVMASDDMMTKDRLEKQFEIFEKNQQIDVVYSATTVYNQNDYTFIEQNYPIFKRKLLEKEQLIKYVSTRDFDLPLLQSALFKRSCFEKTIFLRETYTSDDWAILVYVSQNFNLGYLDSPALVYRLHENNSYKKYWETLSGRIQVASLLCPYKYRDLAFSNIFYSISEYLLNDSEYKKSFKFFISSIIMKFQTRTIKKYLFSLIKKSVK